VHYKYGEGQPEGSVYPFDCVVSWAGGGVFYKYREESVIKYREKSVIKLSRVECFETVKCFETIGRGVT